MADAPKLPDPADHPRLESRDYRRRLPPLQYLMRSVTLSYFRQKLSGVLAVEGSDAAGKGGAIRRLTGELDPRHYDVWPIGPPSAEDLAHPYLWRFWQRIPADGTVAIFDRSWYGRVLVERVDGLIDADRWRQAYDEINAFEQGLVANGVRLIKVYLHVSPEEQRRRLAERVRDAYKSWKISPADVRAYLASERYAEAAAEMFARTSSEAAPWHVIAADDKYHTRVRLLEIVTAALGRGVDLSPVPLDPETLRLAADVIGVTIE